MNYNIQRFVIYEKEGCILMKNRILLAAIGVIGVCLMCGCDRIPKEPNEAKMMEDIVQGEFAPVLFSSYCVIPDLEEQLDTEVDIYQSGWSNSIYAEVEDMFTVYEEVPLIIDTIEIVKRQTNEKEDTVYCEVVSHDEMGAYKSTAQYILYYNYYDQGGWILDYAEMSECIVEPTNGLPQEKANEIIKEFGAESSWENVEYIADELDIDETAIGHYYAYTATANTSMVDVVAEMWADFYCDIEENSITWVCDLYGEVQCDWAIEGQWSSDDMMLIGSGESILQINSCEGDTIDYSMNVIKTGSMDDYNNTYTGVDTGVTRYDDYDFSQLVLSVQVESGWWEPRMVKFYSDGRATIDSNYGGFADLVRLTNTSEMEVAQSSNGQDYILSDSSSKFLTADYLTGLTANECRLARNEIYARYGYIFEDKELQSYFNSKTWYEPTIAAQDFEESMLNEYEIANRDLILAYEAEQGY